MTPSVRIHLGARASSPGVRGRAVCGARVPAEQLAAELAAIDCERCRQVISSPAHAGEIAEQLLAASSGAAAAWRTLAAWIERGVIVGAPPHLRTLLAAVRVELDRRSSSPVPETRPMKTILLALLTLLAPACGDPTGDATWSGSTTDDSTTDDSTTDDTMTESGTSTSSASDSATRGATATSDGSTTIEATTTEGVGTLDPTTDDGAADTDTGSGTTGQSEGETWTGPPCKLVLCEDDAGCAEGLSCLPINFHMACADVSGPACCEPILCEADSDCPPSLMCSGGACVDDTGTIGCSAASHG